MPATSGLEIHNASAVERKPAQRIPQSLVVENKFSDRVGKSSALPPALQTARFDAVGFCRGRPRSPDRVRGSAQLVSGHVAHHRGLTGGVRGIASRTMQISGSCVRVAARGARLCPTDLTSCPGTSKIDRATWTGVPWPGLLEVVQHVLRAVSRPHPEKPVIAVIEAPAPTHGREPRIPDLRKDQDEAGIVIRR